MYLDACLEEDPGDGSVVRAALNCQSARQATRPQQESAARGLYKGIVAIRKSRVCDRPQDHQGSSSCTQARARIIWLLPDRVSRQQRTR